MTTMESNKTFVGYDSPESGPERARHYQWLYEATRDVSSAMRRIMIHSAEINELRGLLQAGIFPCSLSETVPEFCFRVLCLLKLFDFQDVEHAHLVSLEDFVLEEWMGWSKQIIDRLLRLEQSEALRRESGWRLYMPTDLSD